MSPHKWIEPVFSGTTASARRKDMLVLLPSKHCQREGPVVALACLAVKGAVDDSASESSQLR